MVTEKEENERRRMEGGGVWKDAREQSKEMKHWGSVCVDG